MAAASCRALTLGRVLKDRVDASSPSSELPLIVRRDAGLAMAVPMPTLPSAAIVSLVATGLPFQNWIRR